MRKWTIAGAALLAAVSYHASAQTIAAPSLSGVKIAVADFDKATAFYTALGMRAGPQYHEDTKSLQWPDRAQGSNLIIILNGGKSHLARGSASFVVAVPDVTAALDRLKAAGFTGLGEPTVTPRMTVLMIRDPDGNQIELAGPPAAAK